MRTIKPMLARDGGEAVNSPHLIWERKYDGARIIAYTGNDTRLQARSGTDKTETFPEIHLNTKLSAVLDGEIISASGLSFQDSIQKRVNRSNNVAWAMKEYPAEYVVFDVLEIDGKSTETLPLIQRKDLLNQVLIPTDNVTIAPFQDDGEALFTQAKDSQWEGVVGKNKNGIYLRAKREWLKCKCWQMGTFFVVGYTAGTGWREPTFGALVLADAKGNYAGEVGTGMTDKDIGNLCKMFSPAPCPFPREPVAATWVKPFAIKVRFLEYTNEGILRFPSFKGVI